MRREKIFWGSSYDRGLSNLLYIWDDIKKEVPKAELHICYGWDLFIKGYNNNPERMEWMKSINLLMEQDGIFHYGRVGKKELEKIRKECGIWAYPTDFTEINCITALECQKDGVVPVTMNLAALEETAGTGIRIHGDIKDPKVLKNYTEELIGLMKDAKKWHRYSADGRYFAKGYEWKNIAEEWTTQFAKKIEMPKVSVITPTNRTGWWNLMAYNLANQTYPIHEWIIIDDYQDRQPKNAVRMREKYGLNIVYTKTEKDYSRKHSLVRADNIGWQKSSGDLLVWLQDFILIPEHGIESLVDLYRHNKDALLAPTDIHYSLKRDVADFTKPDAFGGSLDVLGENVFINPRNEYRGMRESENPYDFELNYAAIPKNIIEELNGFYEFMDDEDTGYDNTEFAYRAMTLGYRLLVDDSNVASCIRHQDYLKEDPRGNKNQARYEWLKDQIKSGNLPIIRDEKRYEQNPYHGS